MTKMPKKTELGRGISRRLDDFEVYLKSERLSKSTIETYIPIVRRFLEEANGSDLDESDVRAFLANQYDLAGNTARKTHYALSAYFESVGKDFNLSPPKPTQHPSKPTMDLKQMPVIIGAVRDGGTAVEQGALALSSIYGVRRVELMNFGRGDTDFDEQTITIRAAKGGRERTHLIPNAIVSYISNYNFKARKRAATSNLFWQIIDRAGVELPSGYGWHSIRRALLRGLRENKVDILLRHEFTRWRFRDPAMIDMIYDTTPPEEIDKIIFRKHPFLGAWK